MSATYTKLKNGEWGVRVEGTVNRGTVVSVVTKAGKLKTETVGSVLWTGTDRQSGHTISLCAIKQKEQQRDGAHYERGVGMVCDECGERAIKGTKRWETGCLH